MSVKVITPTDLGPEFAIVATKLRANLPPLAQITISTKIGLTVTVSGTDAYAPVGASLLFAWSATGPGTATLATPTASATDIVFSAPGQYMVALAVSDASGNSHTTTRVINVDRILYVGGNQEDTHFTTLQAAFDWLSSNDGATAASYTIFIQSAANDAARVVPNLAKLFFGKNGSLAVGLDYTTAGTYYLAAEPGAHPLINVTSGAAITFTAPGSSLNIANMRLSTADAAAACLSSPSGNPSIWLRDCTITHSANGEAVNVAQASTLNWVGCECSGKVILANVSGLTSRLRNNDFTAPAGQTLLSLTNVRGIIQANRFYTTGAGSTPAAAIATDAPAGNTAYLKLDSNEIRIGTAAGTAPVKGLAVSAGGPGALRIHGNHLFVEAALGIGFHLVGAPPADLFAAGNVIEATGAAVNSTSDAAATAPLPWNNAPLYNNTFRGLISNTTIIMATSLNAGNVQV